MISYRSIYILFRFNDFWPSYGPWTLKFGQIFSCNHFFLLCLEILTWFLICGCIMINYRSRLRFVPVQWFFGRVMALGLKFGQIFSCHHFFAMLGDIDLIFGILVFNDELQIKLTFRSGPMIFCRVMALRLWNLTKYLVVTTLFAMLGDIDLIFGRWVHKDELQIKFTRRSGPMIFD